jgi:hypothetical protein
MNETPKRPWYRLHALTWLICGLLAASLAYVNLGARTRFLVASSPTALGWRHGWPVRAFDRETEMRGKKTLEVEFLLAFGIGQPLVGVDLPYAIVDAAFALIVVVGSSITTESWSRRTGFQLRFRLKTLLSAMAAIAVYCMIFKGERIDVEIWFALLYIVALLTIWLGIVLTWLAFFDLVGSAWRLLTNRRQTNPPRPILAPK